jgi:hypothetical protein
MPGNMRTQPFRQMPPRGRRASAIWQPDVGVIGAGVLIGCNSGNAAQTAPVALADLAGSADLSRAKPGL